MDTTITHFTNLIANGDFQAGNSGFTSAHNYNTVNIYTAGDYQVTDNASNHTKISRVVPTAAAPET